MEEKEKYTVQDFLADPAFKAWILHGKKQELWKNFMDDYPHKIQDIKRAKELLLTLATFTQQSSTENQKSAWRNIALHMEETPVYPIKRNRRLYAYWVAAVSIVLTIGSMLFSYFNQHTATDQVYTSLAGEEKLITLPDSSTVLLIGNSELRHPITWSDNGREVWIQGNAFFDITHTQQSSPFLVHTSPHGTIEVLGTTFSVNATARQVLVHLEEGSIRFAYDGQEVTLVPGEAISLSNQQLILKQSPNVSVMWNKKEIVLENAPLRDILDINEQVFGSRIRLPHDVDPDQLLEGTLPIDRQEHLLEALSLLLNTNIQLEPFSSRK